MLRKTVAIMLVVAGGASCSPADHEAGASTTVPAIAESLHRFRTGLIPITELENAAPSRDSLIHTFLNGVAANDTAALSRLALNVSEFAYLYYPNHPWSKPPYELPPEIMWMQMMAVNDKGLGRLLRDYGGKREDLPESLYPPVIEKNGRYKFVNYKNGL